MLPRPQKIIYTFQYTFDPALMWAIADFCVGQLLASSQALSYALDNVYTQFNTFLS